MIKEKIMDKLLCAGWKQSSCDDGPGMRSVLFLQGCSMHCPGCQNSCTHNSRNGQYFSIEELVAFIIENCRNKKITISGGEPLEQFSSLFVLIKTLYSYGFDICLYTGWDYEKVPSVLHNYLKYLKCGHFDVTKMDPNLMYVGSTNQKMFKNNCGIMEEMNLMLLEECA